MKVHALFALAASIATAKASAGPQCYTKLASTSPSAGCKTTSTTVYTPCTKTKTTYKTKTILPSPVTITSTKQVVKQYTAPPSYHTATITLTKTDTATTTSRITTTAYETSTLSLVSTTTSATPNGFSPIMTSFPGSSYASQQPNEKRDSIRGARGGKAYKKPKKGGLKKGKIPNKVTCVHHKPNSECKVKSVTATKTTGCKGSTITVTATSTKTDYTYPEATTTITTLDTITSTTTAFVTDSTTTTATVTTYTSTTTEYAACATNNFANLYQGQGFSNAVPVVPDLSQDGDILSVDNAYE
ncbi:uncharacterized protein MYCFIDRAFT_83479 [Pseudocercospora fijiensis CIRAD86]|uniref:Uncharacterized protein n=1 Tax=Pseudocercospora fijiensis (strain CIRAD86) TaxID=383855 RepID=M3B7V8_PSEFD|nr:uncharacterized protein MYCFIDRAFT_83479 [Pseudocercospora fijiensis CIRAD86]EME85408.1 hypothetical protein MYCFIDRAFT_83479 [Pseudocercospora fijiensis CIRAD86]